MEAKTGEKMTEQNIEYFEILTMKYHCLRKGFSSSHLGKESLAGNKIKE
jgi:hypothetical protein